MARAILGGLLRNGLDPAQVTVVEPHGDARARLGTELGISADAEPSGRLKSCTAVLWAVKPQAFAEASAPVLKYLAEPLTSASLQGWESNPFRASWVRVASFAVCRIRQRPSERGLPGALLLGKRQSPIDESLTICCGQRGRFFGSAQTRIWTA